MGNLLLAALKGMFKQRLGADFELATCIASMVDLNASYKWQMGNGIFVFDLFSLMSSAACSLIGVLLSVLPSFFTFMQLWEQVNAPEQPGIPVCFGLPHIPQLSWSLQACFTAGWAFKKQTRACFSVFIGEDAEVAVGMLSLLDINTQLGMAILEE